MGVEISTNEQAYLQAALKQGFRLDGRALDQMREPEITLSEDEYGYAEVHWGKTRLSVRITSEIMHPYEDRPFEGIFTILTEISPMAAPSFENGKNSDDKVLISRLIEKAIRRSGALDLESLCIIAGEKVWCVRADINFLSYDGGITDAACVGVMAALQHFRKPDVTVSGGEEVIVHHDFDEREPVPLSILHVPICVTFSFFNPTSKEENIKGRANAEIAIIDADATEEQLRDGSLTITMNKNRELLQMLKSGGLPIDAMQLMRLSQQALTVVERLDERIKNLLKAHNEERYKCLNMRLLEVGASR